MTHRLTCAFTNILDMPMYDGPVQQRQESYLFRESHSYSPVIDKSRLLIVVLILSVLNFLAIPMSSYAAGYSVDQLRVYTHSRVISFNEFICLDQILIKESNYNYKAVNGRHYGIGQMASKHYQSRDPYTQIDLTISYVHARYKTMCKALTFHRKHGYY